MKCIICSNDADATGSHIVPASLIQNCVGKHYREESYSIDAKNVNIDLYFGRDNLKNTSTEIKKNHYKEDHILCQACEKNLADIESEFSINFLQKFREERFKANFIITNDQNGTETLTPKNLTKEKIYFYLYSIIFRYCMNCGRKRGQYFMEESDLENIRIFLNEYMYGDQAVGIEHLKEFNMVITFDKADSNGSFISSANQFKNPYIFYFCQPILLLFRGNLDTNAAKIFGEINGKRYEENLEEFNAEMNKIDINDSERAMKTYHMLLQKYRS